MDPDAPKYAKAERERRFVLARVPPGTSDPREIVDRYIVGTRLRLRTVGGADGRVHKLGHKVRPDPADPGLVLHTSCYLSEAEYDVVAALPARGLRKTRASVPLPDGSLSVDEFHGALAGLVLAEIDLAAPNAPSPAFSPPGYCLAEVTRDERFTGGALAGTDRAALAQLLESVAGVRLGNSA